MEIKFKAMKADVDQRTAMMLIAKGYATKVDTAVIETSAPIKKQPVKPKKKMAFTLVDDDE